MGWFSRWYEDLNDRMTPEWMREMGMSMGMSNPDMGLPDNTMAKPLEEDLGIGNLTVQEKDSLSASRLARIGKYFTSPLGVLSGASTGSGKVFS